MSSQRDQDILGEGPLSEYHKMRNSVNMSSINMFKIENTDEESQMKQK